MVDQTKALNHALTGLEHVYSATLDALSMALDFRDQSTSGHSRRVAELTAGGCGLPSTARIARWMVPSGFIMLCRTV